MATVLWSSHKLDAKIKWRVTTDGEDDNSGGGGGIDGAAFGCYQLRRVLNLRYSCLPNY